MGPWIRPFTGALGLTVVLMMLGCMGWFSSPSGPTNAYRLVIAEDEAPTTEEWATLQSQLLARLHGGGYADAVVSVDAGGLNVIIDRIEGRHAPLRLFEVGAFQVHRVDELQTRVAYRNMRQTIEDAGLSREDPPETLTEVLREKGGLPADRLAFFSETDDGRETLVVVQSIPFLHRDLFSTGQVVMDGEQCVVEMKWTERLASVVGDARVARSSGRVAVMMDGELMVLLSGHSLSDEKQHFRMSSSEERVGEGGRRIWEPRADAIHWCTDLVAVLASGALSHPLELKEMQVNQPE